MKSGRFDVGDGGADGQFAADDQSDLDLVVQEADVGGLDDVVGRSVDRPGCLAEERQWDRRRVHARVLDVRGEVRHLGHDPARRGDRGDQVEVPRRRRCRCLRGGRVDGGAVARAGRAVVVAAVSICTAPVSVWTYQASAVRRTEVVMRSLLSVGRAGG